MHVPQGLTGCGKVWLQSEADPQRLKPSLICGTYGAAEAAPFQNKIKAGPFKTRSKPGPSKQDQSRALSKQNQSRALQNKIKTRIFPHL
jgi:hypothetical protein